MTFEVPPDVEKLVRDHMAAGGYASADDVLRDALLVLGEAIHSSEAMQEEYRQTVIAVQEGVRDAEAGRVRPLRDLIDDARKEPPGGTG